jgi:hypothetical protein
MLERQSVLFYPSVGRGERFRILLLPSLIYLGDKGFVVDACDVDAEALGFRE